MAAVHPAQASALIPESFFDFTETNSAVNYITSMLPRLSLQQSASIAEFGATGESSHLLSIIARMLRDPRLDPGNLKLPSGDLGTKFEYVQSQSGDVIKEYVDQWDIRLIGDSAADTSILDAKIEEVYWAHVLFYGVGGWNEEKGFLANFVK